MSQNGEFTVCLSHDVDHVRKTFQFISHFFRELRARHPKSVMYQVRSLLMRDHYWGFEKIIEIEGDRGLRSTFFFLNETYPFRLLQPSSWRLSMGFYDMLEPAVQDIIRRLDQKGWEIGLHGSYLSYNDGSLLDKEKADLESILEHPVRGIRQHYLNRNEKTWDLQSKAGFLYDASWGYTDGIGFKDGKYHGYKPLGSRDFWVIPICLMDFCVMSRRDPFSEAVGVIENARERGGCVVLNWHQRMFNSMEYPGVTDMYINIIEECQRRGGNFKTIGQYVNELRKTV